MAGRWSAIHILTGPDVEQVRLSKPQTSMLLLTCATTKTVYLPANGH